MTRSSSPGPESVVGELLSESLGYSLEQDSSTVVCDPPSTPSTLQGSLEDGLEDFQRDSRSPKRQKIDGDRWIMPIQIDMTAPDWWRIHWPAYKAPEKLHDASSIFEPLHTAFSYLIREEANFQLSFEIRHLVVGVTTGKDGEYIGPSSTKSRSGRRHRVLNKVVPEPPKKTAIKVKKESNKSPMSENWDACSDLTSLSELEGADGELSVPDDSDSESVLTSLTELEEERLRHPNQPKLIGNLPIATPLELNCFEPLLHNILPTRNSALAGFMEGKRKCFCLDGSSSLDDPKLACREASRCINRFMNVECPPMECGASESCGNQRIQKSQFAELAIVVTRRKGFGLRSENDITEGNLVCEYTGEVVNGQRAENRLKKYTNNKRNKHIYMMELQKGEYIDATVKGGTARFANHSCNPNCEIQQWIVGQWLRMVLVAKRDILRHEEITFNYNMNFMGDSKVQKCFCREKGCSGFIGRAHVTRKKDQENSASDVAVSPLPTLFDKENYPLSISCPPDFPQTRKRRKRAEEVSAQVPEGRVLRSRVCRT